MLSSDLCKHLGFSLLLVGAIGGSPSSEALAVEGPFVPPDGKTLLIIGQDIDSIDNYNQSISIEPGGVTGYINIGDLSGLNSVVDNGAGRNDLSYLVREYPNSTVALGVFLVDQLGDINNGSLDPRLNELVETLKGYNRPVFLRWGYEFDGPFNRYDPDEFIAAWRRMRQAIKNAGATNIAMVWQSASFCSGTFRNLPFTAWWPGAQYVDWVALSYFAPQDCNNAAVDPIVDFARQENKPLMIAESTPQRYEIAALTYSGTINANDGLPRTADQIWSEWFAPYFSFIQRNDDVIRAVAYINAHWDSQSLWGPPYASGYWGDSRVQTNSIIMNRWIDEVTTATWLHASPTLFDDLTGSAAP